jgi:hypothetical protein
MTSWPTESHDLIGRSASHWDEEPRTHPRVQVISLFVCALASFTLVPVTHVPWFGPFSNTAVEPQYSAVSGVLVPPGSPAGMVPGTQSWGYLLIAWSALLAGLAVAALCICTFSRRFRYVRGASHLLVAVGIAALILVALVVAEFVPRVPFDGPDTLGFSWGAILGLVLAVVSAIGAWFAWATLNYPHLWGTKD